MFNENQRGTPLEDKIYGTLYEELIDKCNPVNFMYPYDKDKVDAANLIYKKLLGSKPKHKCYSNHEIRGVKDLAIRELGISISDSLYRKLINYCDPKRFMSPYDFEAVQVANELYSLIEESKDDIVELEKLQHRLLRNEVLKAYITKNINRSKRGMVGFKRSARGMSSDDMILYSMLFISILVLILKILYPLIIELKM